MGQRIAVMLLLQLAALGARGQINTGLEQEDLAQFLQPDTVGDPSDPAHNSSRRCDRACVQGARPKLCYYKFTVEDYHTLGAACGNCPAEKKDCGKPQCVTADGIERGLLTANRRMAGPSIQVCLGDRVVVDVHNVMPGRSTTIHFHGIFQDESNSMDGVPMVTQCPVVEGATFRYDFLANNAGTHFWHSHDGFQKMDGLQGSLIVRQPRDTDPSSKLYDDDLAEHVILLTDWFEDGSDLKFPGLLKHMPGQEPVSYLFNGKGRVTPTIKVPRTKSITKTLLAYGKQFKMRDILENEVSAFLSEAAPSKPAGAKVPLTTFTVSRGRRHRFRLISGTCAHCPAEVSIAQHRMRVIATDGNSVKPVNVDRIVVLPGERYDFVLEANQSVSAYWIQARGLGPCEERNVSGVAILKYKKSQSKVPPTPDPGHNPVNARRTVTLNPIDNKCGPKDADICVNELETADPFDRRLLDPLPDVKLHFTFNFWELTKKETFEPGSYQRFLQPVVPVLVTAHMNNISNVLGGSPLLSQYHDIPPELFCPANGCPAGERCECLHVVKVPLNALVQMVIADEAMPAGDLHHPFHLHGHKFHVLELGQFSRNESRRKADLRKEVDTASDAALVKLRKGGSWFAGKDTIAVPAGGFAVVRFVADNPGFWMIHCHFIYHQVVGMNLILQVGDLNEMPPPPPGFPTCGNFVGRLDVSQYL